MDRVEWTGGDNNQIAGVGGFCNYWIERGNLLYKLSIQERGKKAVFVTYKSHDAIDCMQHAELIESNHMVTSLELEVKTLKDDLFKLQRSTTIDQGSFAGPDAKDDK